MRRRITKKKNRRLGAAAVGATTGLITVPATFGIVNKIVNKQLHKGRLKIEDQVVKKVDKVGDRYDNIMNNINKKAKELIRNNPADALKVRRAQQRAQDLTLEKMSKHFDSIRAAADRLGRISEKKVLKKNLPLAVAIPTVATIATTAKMNNLMKKKNKEGNRKRRGLEE